MRTGVLRFALHKTPDASLQRHIEGLARNPGEVEREGIVPIPLQPGEGLEAAMEACKHRTKARGPKPACWADFVLAGPPPFDAPDAWSPERIDQWEEDSMEWFRSAFPASVIVAASRHQDKRSPHIQILVLLRDSDGYVGSNRAVPKAVGLEREEGKEFWSRCMSLMQDDYHKRVSRPNHLGRGVRGSRTKHRAVDLEMAVRDRTAEGHYVRGDDDVQEMREQINAQRSRIHELDEHARAEREAATRAEAWAVQGRARRQEAEERLHEHEAKESERKADRKEREHRIFGKGTREGERRLWSWVVEAMRWLKIGDKINAVYEHIFGPRADGRLDRGPEVEVQISR